MTTRLHPAEGDQAQGTEGVEPGELRAAMARFASGVTVITALLDGAPRAMTATAFCSVSLTPPLVLVSVGQASRFHPVLAATQDWAVSVLAADQQALAAHFSDPRRDLRTQFDAVPTDPAPYSKAPVLPGAAAWLDCRTWARHEAGDHTLVLGLVRAVGEGAFETVLTYHRSRYGQLD